jgi:hypothetical protein
MNIRIPLICISALGLASVSGAASISYAILGNGGFSGTANVAGQEPSVLQSAAGRSASAVDLGTHHPRLHRSRIPNQNTHTTESDYTANSVPLSFSIGRQDGQTLDVWANVRTDSSFPWYDSSVWLNESALWTALFAVSPGRVSRIGDGGPHHGPAYEGWGPAIATSSYVKENPGTTPSAYAGDFWSPALSGGDHGYLSSGQALCGSHCFTDGTNVYVPGDGRHQLLSGANNLAGVVQMHQPAASQDRSVTMSEPDTSVLFIVDLAFLAAVVTFLRSKRCEKKTGS